MKTKSQDQIEHVYTTRRERRNTKVKSSKLFEACDYAVTNNKGVELFFLHNY